MFVIYRWLFNQFGFSRSQSNGFLVLLPLTCLITFSEPAFRYFQTKKSEDFSNDIKKLDSLVALFNVRHPASDLPADTSVLFFFDPNTIQHEELQKLGFPNPVANRLIQYVAKGGKFKTKGDLLKIYGLDSSLYARVHPYIRLSEIQNTQREQKAKTRVPDQHFASFDLNEADTAVLKHIRGIGSKLSRRIIRYREALGGFYSVDQLYEVYALDSALVDEIKKITFISNDFRTRLINLNTAGRQEIASHPYFTSQQAGSIVAYRFTHGSFVSIKDLRKIGGVDSLTFAKVEPYLAIK